MLKRLSTTAALLAVLVGTTVGLSAPASAVLKTPSYADPVNNVSVQLEHNVQNPVVVVQHYRVRSGNTLSQIAHKFDLNWKKLYCANRGVIGKDPNMIASGIKLKIRESHHVWCPITVEHPAAVGGNSSVSVSSVPAAPAQQQNYVGGGSFQQCVIMAESGGDPTAYNSSSGASGLYGFLLSTWDSLGLGYPGGAYTAPVSVQNEGFAIEYARAGTAPWAPYDGC